MSFKELKTVCAAKVAGPQKETVLKDVNSPSTSLAHTSPLLNASSMYPFITETYRDLQSYISGLRKDFQLMQTVNKYKKGCNEVYAKALVSHNICYQLAQNIVRTIDIFKELCTCLPDLEEYNYRLCEIISIFIVCELRLSADAAQQDQILIAQRIIYVMRRHLVQEEEQETSYNILRTLVYIPKLFNARDIMCAIFGEFIPLKPVPEVNVLPDKLYMLYIIVFYRWMMMQKDDDDKILIVNFAESFMKPSVSLCSNNLYGAYLPMYTKHSTATRTILNNLKYYGDIRNACIIDNALKQIGAVVNLCDDEEDDVIFVDVSTTTDFAQLFASIRLEHLNGGISNIKLEEETVVETVDLTAEEEQLRPKASINDLHDNWLNDFQRLAKQYQESQLLLEKQQNIQVVSNGQNDAIVCLDSDSEEESENISAADGKESSAERANKVNNLEDLFADNYPITNTPLNCDSNLEFLDADDGNDTTKISSMFLSSNLRTYQPKKTNLLKSNDKIKSVANGSEKTEDTEKAYRRDSIHISSTPPEEPQNEEDEGTDVQDENDDLFEEEDEAQAYTYLPTSNKRPEKELFPKQIQPMGPYPTYNSMHNDKVVFSQSLPRYSQHHHYQQKQYYHSDNSEIKSPKKQKKKVQFNTNPLGPTAATDSQKILKPVLQQKKYKASDALDFYDLRELERYSCAPRIEKSVLTSSSNKQQDHLEAAALFFRQTISPSPSSASSRTLTSPTTSSTSRKKTRFTKMKKSTASIIQHHEVLNAGYHSTDVPSISSYGESSDDYYGVASDSDIIINERYKNDAKLRKRCAVVITPSNEILQKYNEILLNQRRKQELRTLEKQREKERRRREENSEQTELNIKETSAVVNDEAVRTCSRRTRNNQENFMSSESENETTFHERTRRHKTHNCKELKSLNIRVESTEATTTLLNQIDAHLDKPTSAKSHSFEMKNHQQIKQTVNNDGNQQTCDINSDKSQTKMRELNLLADIAQHLPPYQLDLPTDDPPRTPSSALDLSSVNKAASPPASFNEVPKEKVIVTEQLFIQSTDNLLENRKPQLDNNYPQQALSSYAHEPKLNTTAILQSSPSANFMQNENPQADFQSQNENNNNRKKEQNLTTQTNEALEQILEESISVLTVTSPYNPQNEQQTPQIDNIIPILISNVSSLNQHAQKDIAKQKSDNRMQFNVNNSTKSDSENSVLNERKEKSYNDLSDIFLESELSKNLPEIAEPSPVVTDISDYSNESNVSKNFEHQCSNGNNNTTSMTTNNEIYLPASSLVMRNVIQSSATSHENSLVTNFNQFNSSLNTPVKHTVEITRETDLVNKSTNDISTPLKFVMQPELEVNTTPLKNSLEPESDNNVTKFLEIILNKTVTDSESETHDKIIKELNALTADAVVASETNTFSNNEIKQSESDLQNEQNKLIDSDIQVETIKCVKKQFDKEISLKENILSIGIGKSKEAFEYSSCIRKEKMSLSVEKSELKSITEQQQLRTPSANNDLTPTITDVQQEDRRVLLCDIKTTELPTISPLTSLSPTDKSKIHAIKQIFNSKCRVRLKRLNMDDHCTISKIESTPTILITNTVQLQNANKDVTKCDSAREKSLPIKKTSLKTNNKHVNKEVDKPTENVSDATIVSELTPVKKLRLDYEKSIPTNAIQTTISQKSEQHAILQISKTSDALVNNTNTIAKSKPKSSKTVTFDLSNLNEEFRDNISNHKQKAKTHAALGCFLKNSRTSRKLPDNTLRAAETLQMYVNTINARTPSPRPAEFNKKRSPIKNKCIAEDESPRPPPASSLIGTPPCKKSCTEKSRSHLISKCKDQLVSSLTTSSIPSITSDITTARIYTSSPLDQTLPEYDDNVDTVGDSELILQTTSGSLRRKLKRPKKSLLRPEPTDDVCPDDIVNQPDCNREDDAAVDNDDDDFAEELLPIPAANEHILEEIVSARPTHIGTSTVIRDKYMNIEATATVPDYLFNDESRDLGSPEVIQNSDYTNVVDSSSYLNATPTTAPSNLAATSASTTSTMGNLEKSMLSPSEHEVSSTQETFYQTPTKNKQTELFGEKFSTSKEKGSTSSGLTANTILKQKPEGNNLQNKEDCHTSSTVGLLQNNQVDTTNNSPEMCTLALTATTKTTPTLTNSRKIRKASTHDEILFNELLQQLPSTLRKSNNTTFCVESTSGNTNISNKTKVIANSLDDIKSKGSLAKEDDKYQNLLKEVCKIDKNQAANNTLDMGLASASNNSGGGSSPSTTTTINEDSLPRSKRKKLKSSKSKKSKNRPERTSKISLKPSKLAEHIPTSPLIITIPKSRLLKPPSSPPTPIESQDDQSEIFNTPNGKLFIEKNKEPELIAKSTAVRNTNQISFTKKELIHIAPVVASKSKCAQNRTHLDTSTELNKLDSIRVVETNIQPEALKLNCKPTPEETSGASTQTIKKREKLYNKSCRDKNSKSIFAKDKYDLIKSKDKHQHHHNPDHQNNKDKSKEKANSQSKSLTSNSSRLHKGSTKEKVKGEKSKEKHKISAKSSMSQSQPDNVLKLTTCQISNKSSVSSSATSLSAAQLVTINIKQNNNKTNKANIPSPSIATLPISATHKSKVNSSTTSTAATPSHTTTAPLSTNNVRKKYKTK